MSSPKKATTVSTARFTESSVDADLRSTVNQVLLSNNCIPQIHATLLHEAQASGFVDQVRARAVELFRSGKATTFAECMEQIMAHIKIEGIDSDASSGANGTSKAANGAEDTIVVPKKVVTGGRTALITQLEPFLDFKNGGDAS